MLSELNNTDVVKKIQRIEVTFTLILEIIKQLRLALNLNMKLTKEQKNRIIQELESIFNQS